MARFVLPSGPTPLLRPLPIAMVLWLDSKKAKDAMLLDLLTFIVLKALDRRELARTVHLLFLEGTNHSLVGHLQWRTPDRRAALIRSV